MKTTGTLLVALVVVLGLSTAAFSHCQIPCGIYDDHSRFGQMREEVTTIEKSINEINTLSAAGEKNYNQLVRWINNKEDHANKLQETVTQYFMFQRIKPAEKSDTAAWDKYQNLLTLAHHIAVYAMKTKQTLDLENITKLRETIDQFETAYFAE